MNHTNRVDKSVTSMRLILSTSWTPDCYSPSHEPVLMSNFFCKRRSFTGCTRSVFRSLTVIVAWFLFVVFNVCFVCLVFLLMPWINRLFGELGNIEMRGPASLTSAIQCIDDVSQLPYRPTCRMLQSYNVAAGLSLLFFYLSDKLILAGWETAFLALFC